MDTAHTYLDDYPGGIEAANRNMAMAGGAIDPVTLTMYDARQTLAAGNLAVYDELYPPLQFYAQIKGKISGRPTEGAMTMLLHEAALRQPVAVHH